MASAAEFRIVYDGSALVNNEIAVRELAPALISVADLLEEANLIINGKESRIDVNVKGSFKSGSFGIDLTVVQNFIDGFIGIFSANGVTAAVNLLTLVGFLQNQNVSLIGLIKLLRNRPIEKIENVNDRFIAIHITHEEKVEVDKRILDLYKNPRIRQSLENTISKPLDKEGIDKVITSSGEIVKNVMEISKEEKDYFKVPDVQEEILGENISDVYLQAVSISFISDNKWRFKRGETIFYASVEDEDFIDRVNRNEIQFAKDDILKVSLYSKDYLSPDGMKTLYIVKKVLEHRSAAIQLHLPMKEDNN